LNKIVIKKHIGEGGYGTIFEGEINNYKYAIKQIEEKGSFDI
jgi:hypothetical protein